MADLTIDDLSYSVLVDAIQNDRAIGRELLIKIARERDALLRKKNELELSLSDVNLRLKELKSGSEHIVEHLHIETPFAIKVDEGIIVCSPIDITIERNVL